MLQDLHSHTYYSYCGGDRPEEIIEAAIAGGIELFGINDHVNGVITHVPEWDALGKDGWGSWVYDRMLHRYHDHIGLLREKYKDPSGDRALHASVRPAASGVS